MNARALLAIAVLVAKSVLAAPPQIDDYAQGITIDTSSTQPLIEATLPDAVYRTVARADLGDLRVFNADGVPVPHALCPAPQTAQGATDIEPRWFMANHSGSGEAGMLLFDTARLAPVRYARLRLPQENSSVRVSLQSRADDESSWRERWRGETYLIVTGAARRKSPPARFDATTDRHWRVQILQDAQSHPPITLELGYRPARLRFLAQQPGPYTLAFGSRRAESAPPTACDALLADVSAEERARLIGAGHAAGMRVLGGDEALRPLPAKTPVRRIVLWSVLVAGVILLIAMALSLLKRVAAKQS